MAAGGGIIRQFPRLACWRGVMTFGENREEVVMTGIPPVTVGHLQGDPGRGGDSIYVWHVLWLVCGILEEAGREKRLAACLPLPQMPIAQASPEPVPSLGWWLPSSVGWLRPPLEMKWKKTGEEGCDSQAPPLQKRLGHLGAPHFPGRQWLKW